MPQLTLASANAMPRQLPTAQWAHDIRNALAITSLHLEILERLSGSVGRKAANAAQTAMKRAAGMCSASLADPGRVGQATQRCSFDLIKTIKEIVTVLEPIVPEGFEIRTSPEVHCMVLANPSDAYRIIFNLVHNAIEVARNDASMSYVSIEIAHMGAAVAVRIFDDGPGLPESVRSKVFRHQSVSTTGGSGLGIAIARELAERNGSTLRLANCLKGTSYVFELASVRVIARALDRIQRKHRDGV